MVSLLRGVVICFFLAVVFSGISIAQCLYQDKINFYILVLGMFTLSISVFMLMKINRMLIRNPELMIEPKKINIRTTKIMIKNVV